MIARFVVLNAHLISTVFCRNQSSGIIIITQRITNGNHDNAQWDKIWILLFLGKHKFSVNHRDWDGHNNAAVSKFQKFIKFIVHLYIHNKYVGMIGGNLPV